METCLELTSVPESFSNCKSHPCISLCKSDSALWVTAGSALASKATRSTGMHATEAVMEAHTAASGSSSLPPCLYFCLCWELDFKHSFKSPRLGRPSSNFNFKVGTEDIFLSEPPKHFPSTKLSSSLPWVEFCLAAFCDDPRLWGSHHLLLYFRFFSLIELILNNYLDLNKCFLHVSKSFVIVCNFPIDHDLCF